MSETPLSERKRLILKAIVESHILDGEPVGSKALTANQQLSCSSATIRNEMAELESLGYLEQPHTSAGRVPTALGYRFYVDSLAHRYSMTAMEIEQINRALRHKIGELDAILEDASRLVSSFTNYTGVAIKPPSSSATVSRFESAYLDEHSFVLVMLFSDTTIKTKSIYTALSITADELALFIRTLNLTLTGRTASEITLPHIVEIETLIGTLSPLVHPTVKAIYEAMNELDGGELKIEGVNHLLEYPEFSDVNRFKELLALFEHKENLLDIVSEDTEAADGLGDVQVRIGGDHLPDAMDNSAFVYRTVRRGGKVVGAVGVIGPCRMDYSRVIALLNHLTDGISDAIEPPSLPAIESGESKGENA